MNQSINSGAIGIEGTVSSGNNSTGNIGVWGTVPSTGNNSIGVEGSETGASGTTYGVYGVVASPAGFGVAGQVTATTGTTSGVLGATASTGSGAGVGGFENSSNNTGAGVYGENLATSGVNFGVQGVASGAGNTGYGVYGLNASAAAGSYGVYCSSGAAAGCGGNQVWTNASDRRLKEHIVDLPAERGLAAVMKLRPVTYHWKDKKMDQSQRIGLIAQEVQTVFPEAVGVGPKGMLTLAYSDMVMPLIKAVQQLAHEMSQLAEKINPLDAKLLEQQDINAIHQAELNEQRDDLARQQAEIDLLSAQLAAIQPRLNPPRPAVH